MISVPRTAWYAPPPGPTMPTIEELKNSASSRASPLLTTSQTRLTSGTIASRNAPWTRQVTNRSVAARRPSTARVVPTTAAVPSTPTASTSRTTLTSVVSSSARATSARTPKTAEVNQRGISRRPPRSPEAADGAAEAGGVRVGVLIGSLRELGPAVDDRPGEEVDREGDDEQRQAARDQHVHREAAGFREVERDVGGDGGGFGAADQVERHRARRYRQHDRHGERLAQRAAEAEHGTADDTRAAVGEHRHADHLPAGRAQGQRRLAVQPGRLAEHLAGDRADDRQDHDREHETGGRQRAPGGRGRAGEERQPARVLCEPLVEGHQLRREPGDAPEPEDDARDRGQQVDHVPQGLRHPPWRVVGDEQRDPDRQRRRDEQRDDRRQQRAEQQRPDVGDQALVAGQVG